MASRWFRTDAVEDDDSPGEERHLRIDPVTGILLLGVTKALDAATTAFALVHVPWIEEGNPVVASVFHALGPVVGIIVLSIVGVVALVAATEFVAASVDDTGDGYPGLIRLIGYVPTSALFLILGIQNAVLVLTGVSLFAL